MSDAELSTETVRAMANDIGLTRLSAEHIEQLARAIRAANARRSVLHFDKLHYADEPAHVYVLPTE